MVRVVDEVVLVRCWGVLTGVLPYRRESLRRTLDLRLSFVKTRGITILGRIPLGVNPVRSPRTTDVVKPKGKSTRTSGSSHSTLEVSPSSENRYTSGRPSVVPADGFYFFRPLFL